MKLKINYIEFGQVVTSSQNISCDEYISGIDLEQNCISYDLDTVKFSKTFCFDKDSDLLCIKYEVYNNSTNVAKFKILPFITYRELFKMKNSQTLRFNERKLEDGVLINLSIMNEENVIIKSDKAKYVKSPKVLVNVKHEYVTKELNKEIVNEDLVIPGTFDIDIKKESSCTFYVYISSKDFKLKEIDENGILDNARFFRQSITDKIQEEYIELKDLALQIENFNRKNSMACSLPYTKSYPLDFNVKLSDKLLKEDVVALTDVTKAIEGQYLTFGKVKKANSVLLKIMEYIKQIDRMDKTDIDSELVLLKLWYIESVNRLLQKDNSLLDSYLSFMNEILYDVLSNSNKDKYLINIQTCALSYNAIKIYQNFLTEQDEIMYHIAEYIQDLILTKFWDEEKRTMKQNIDDVVAKPNIDMVYTFSLSYPCIVGDISIKLLDTIFKELYTPYGLRDIPRSDSEVGYIYPRYMAHFIKANLRQNGVTRASQKIAFNLVKELFQDINKYMNGGIMSVYSEKGILIDDRGYDLYTNAEIIRLYDMLS
ncbi:MAG: glycogen debranching enzyme N-terminal domain-containing protein [Clostridia bacterium]|nr:glycogen debranching enzyme N-terminal domain-containing protein [Clostridia bacterium]